MPSPRRLASAARAARAGSRAGGPLRGAEGDVAVGVVDEQGHGPVGQAAARGVAVQHGVGVAPLDEGEAPEVLAHVDVDRAVRFAVVGQQPLGVEDHGLRAGQAHRLAGDRPLRAARETALAGRRWRAGSGRSG